MKLTPALINALEVPSRDRKVYDGRGLYLLLTRTGTKLWRFKYHRGGREKSLSLGIYPAVGILQARQDAEAARELLRRGMDPSMARKEERAARQDADEETFERVALEFLGQKDSLAARTQSKHRWSLKLLHRLWAVPIHKLTTAQIVQTLKAIEGPGTSRRESAHRARSLVMRACRYAMQTGRLTVNPAADLRESLKPIRSKPRPAILKPSQFGLLLWSIDMCQGSSSVANALKLAPHLALRPGELRTLEWSEVSFRDAEILLPASKTKMRRPHVAPLSRQSIEILKTQHALSGHGRYVFPGPRTLRPISDMTLTMALHTVSPAFGREDQSMHGFRASFSTMANELGWDSALIELALGHQKTDKVAAAYDRSQRLTERRRMAQEWSDYLDQLREEAKGQ
jgi:integrase